MTLELTSKEIQIVRQLIEQRLKEIGPEIHHTDSRGYRHGLADDQESLRALQQRLSGVPA